MTTTATSTEILAVPRDGLTRAEVRIGFGGGELTVGPAQPGMLVAGTFEGGVITRSTTPGSVALEPPKPGRLFRAWQPLRWHVGVTAEIPVDLRLDTGGNRSTIDLAELRIPRLEVHTGASDSTVRLPAGGQTSVHAACGMASLTLEVPAGVAARVRGAMALGSLAVDETRFPRAGKEWASPDYDAALDRVDVEVEGGLGSVRVT